VDRRTFLARFFGGILGVGVGALMTTRVHMGRLDAITGGTDQFGLYVSGPDGTAIIDGTSNVFKITATGTLSGTQATGSDGAVESITLTGLGIQTEIPAHTSFGGTDSAVTNPRIIGSTALNRLDLWAAPSSGASPTTQFIAFRSWERVLVELDASPGYIQLSLWIKNVTGGNSSAHARFYTFLEVGG